MNNTTRTDQILESTWKSVNVPSNPIPADFARQLERELNAVTKQLDKEREIYEKSYSAELARSNHYKQQRDKLAVAVNAATILIAAKGRHNTMLAYNGLREALQSLTPKDHE